MFSFGKSNFSTSVLSDAIFSSSTVDSNLPILDSPIISVTRDIDNDALIRVVFDSISWATSYRLFVDGIYKESSQANQFEYQFQKNATYRISVKAYGDGYKASKSSNVETIIVTSFGGFLFTGLRFLSTGLRKILTGRS